MPKKAKENTKKELERIYKSQYEWLKAGKKLRNNVSGSLQESPKLNLLLKLVIIANIGIWLSVFMMVSDKI